MNEEDKQNHIKLRADLLLCKGDINGYVEMHNPSNSMNRYSFRYMRFKIADYLYDWSLSDGNPRNYPGLCKAVQNISALISKDIFAQPTNS